MMNNITDKLNVLVQAQNGSRIRLTFSNKGDLKYNGIYKVCCRSTGNIYISHELKHEISFKDIVPYILNNMVEVSMISCMSESAYKLAMQEEVIDFLDNQFTGVEFSQESIDVMTNILISDERIGDAFHCTLNEEVMNYASNVFYAMQNELLKQLC